MPVAGGGLDLVATTGALYVLGSGGYQLFDVSSPTSPVLRRASAGGPTDWRFLAVNGSGTLIAAHVTGTVPAPKMNLYRTSDTGDEFITRIEMAGTPRGLSIFNGLGYVADGAAGLHVLNYLPFDSKKVPPGIVLQTSFKTNASGQLTLEEGQPFRLTALTSDDVQVRNVEFYIDGQRVLTDGNTPFESRFIAPLSATGTTNVIVRAKATDTGGNITWSDEIKVTLTPDQTPPRVRATFPEAGTVLGSAFSVSATFTEPIMGTALLSGNLLLAEAGADGVFGTGDDHRITGGRIEYQEAVATAFLVFPTNRARGFYQAQAVPPVYDRAGNSMTAPHRWSFWLLGEQDSDQDGIPNDEELRLGLDPNNPDTNGNGVLDGDEDSDSDALAAKWELLLGHDPSLRDTGATGRIDGEKDTDRDTLTDSREISLSLNPLRIDSDKDGWDDATEVLDRTDPANPDSGPIVSIASPALNVFNGALLQPVFDAPVTISSPVLNVFNGAFHPGPTNAVIHSRLYIIENR